MKKKQGATELGRASAFLVEISAAPYLLAGKTVLQSRSSRCFNMKIAGREERVGGRSWVIYMWKSKLQKLQNIVL